jgi:hypothetical protein
MVAKSQSSSQRADLRAAERACRKHGADGFFEIMMHRLRPLPAQGQVPVIDPPAVYLVQALHPGEQKPQPPG